jgi:uncharacterized protein (DUF983 family)
MRCPRCLEGRVFRGAIDMNERCPECGLVFEREPGYFTGAMVVSYLIAVVVYAALVLLLWSLPGWRVEVALAVAAALFFVAVPAIFRYSRVIWMHFDHAVDPHPPSGT